MTTKYKSVPDEPTLVVWVLYDATTDKKFVKMDPADGSLAIFDSEEAAMSAKRAHSGTDYKRCEYHSAPQPTPEVEKLVEALEQSFPLLNEEGLDEVGHHCEWEIQRERKLVHSILAAYRKQGGDL